MPRGGRGGGRSSGSRSHGRGGGGARKTTTTTKTVTIQGGKKRVPTSMLTVIMLDRSPSMEINIDAAGTTRMRAAKNGARELLEQLKARGNPYDVVIVTVFDRKISASVLDRRKIARVLHRKFSASVLDRRKIARDFNQYC